MKKVVPTPEERVRFESDCLEYRLAWKCTDCAHYAGPARKCSLEYPTSELMNAVSYDAPNETYVFCKHFELI